VIYILNVVIRVAYLGMQVYYCHQVTVANIYSMVRYVCTCNLIVKLSKCISVPIVFTCGELF